MIKNSIIQAIIESQNKLKSENIPVLLYVNQIKDNNADWVGMYQHNSIIDGTIEIWINETYFTDCLLSEEELIKELKITIFHELIHAFQNLQAFCNNNDVFYDEDEAERIGQEIANGNKLVDYPIVQHAIKLFNNINKGY